MYGYLAVESREQLIEEEFFILNISIIILANI